MRGEENLFTSNFDNLKIETLASDWRIVATTALKSIKPAFISGIKSAWKNIKKMSFMFFSA